MRRDEMRRDEMRRDEMREFSVNIEQRNKEGRKGRRRCALSLSRQRISMRDATLNLTHTLYYSEQTHTLTCLALASMIADDLKLSLNLFETICA